jgi:hypothetical protein
MAVMKITKIAEGMESLKAGKRDRQPGQRRHRAQDLKDGVQAAIGETALPDQHAQRHAADRRHAETDGDPLQAGQNLPEQPHIVPPLSKKGSLISAQVSLITLLGGGREAPPGLHRICHSKSSNADGDQRRQHHSCAFARLSPTACSPPATA